jgi:hypothetical protein
MALLGPSDYYFDVVDEDGFVTVQFATKSTFDSEKELTPEFNSPEYIDATTHLNDYFDTAPNEILWELDDFEFDSELTIQETIKFLESQGFTKAKLIEV